MKHVFEELGITAWASHLTRWVTIQGQGQEEGYDMDSPEFASECPSFVRKALGLKAVPLGI